MIGPSGRVIGKAKPHYGWNTEDTDQEPAIGKAKPTTEARRRGEQPRIENRNTAEGGGARVIAGIGTGITLG